MKEVNEIIKEMGYVDIKENPSVMTSICEYIIINGIHSDWNAVYEAMQHLKLGEEQVSSSWVRESELIKKYLGKMFKYISNLYNIWCTPLYKEECRYFWSKDEVIYLIGYAFDVMHFIYENYYEEEI